MPQITSISINDRESTPVSHTYTANGRAANGTVEAVRNTGVLAASESLKISARDGSKYHNVKLSLTIPIVQTETINGISRPLVVRTGRANVEFSFDLTSTLQERQNLVGLIANALAANQTDLNKVLTVGEAPW